MNQARALRKARLVNATDTSFPAKAPTRTEPAGDAETATGASVIDLAQFPGGLVPEAVILTPYGTDTANQVFSLRLVGWRKVGNGPTALWVPEILAELSCTLGAMTGAAGADVLDTELFCDTISVVKEPVQTADTTPFGTVTVFSPANDTVAWAKTLLYGVQKLELIFDMTTNNPTGANCLLSFMNDED